MSNIPTQNQPQPVSQPVAPKQNILSKIIGGFSWWIGSLSGKPQVRKIPVQAPVAPPQSQQQPLSPTASASAGDSVSEDLEKFRNIVGKFSSTLSKNVKPAVSKGVAGPSKAASTFTGKVIDKGFLKNILKVFFVILVLMTLAFVGLKFFRNIPPGVIPGTASPTPAEATPTPTPLVFTPFKPSVYAEDPVTLKLEKDIDVLVREISGTNIKETQLNPPILDFNVTF